jgi:curved DNA-binding protein CbpA
LEEIKKRYRKLVLVWHPDKNNGSEEAKEKFHEIQDAFEKLTLQDSEQEQESVPLAREPSPSPRPSSQRYRSPPPVRRRRSTSPPLPGDQVRGEPIFEERRPRGASPKRQYKRQESESVSRRESARPPPPPKVRDYRPRGRSGSREDPHRRMPSPSPPPHRLASPEYELRKPRGASSPRPIDGDRMSTIKYSCTLSPAPRWEEPRYGPSPQVKVNSEQTLNVPSIDRLLDLNDDAWKLVRRIERSLTDLIDWLRSKPCLEEHKPRMQFMLDARDDAVGLDNQRIRLKNKIMDLRDDGGWTHSKPQVLDFYDDLQEMIVVLRAADNTLYSLVKKFASDDGRKFNTDRDWQAARRQTLWDGIERFRNQVKKLPKPPARRSSTTTTYYKVRYVHE